MGTGAEKSEADVAASLPQDVPDKLAVLAGDEDAEGGERVLEADQDRVDTRELALRHAERRRRARGEVEGHEPGEHVRRPRPDEDRKSVV